MKFVDSEVTFAEVPDEITLCINISNCPCHCKGCHSSYLAEDIGEELDHHALESLIMANEGITCISFMGGDSSPESVNFLASWIKMKYPKLKVSWYSGRQELNDQIQLKNFDYIKLGPYNEDLGPLNNRNTNQRFYKVEKINKIKDKYVLKDITNKFWHD